MQLLNRRQVGNVHKLLDSLNYIGGFTGFHEFAEFTAEDVGTLDSGAYLQLHTFRCGPDTLQPLRFRMPCHGSAFKAHTCVCIFPPVVEETSSALFIHACIETRGDWRARQG